MRRALRGVFVSVCLAAGLVAGSEGPPPFPNLAFRSLDESRVVTVEQLRGKPVLITFWASWCGPCRVELPELQRIHEELERKGFVLLAVNVDASVAAARRFLELTRVKVPVYRMSQSDLAAIGVNGIPTNLLLDLEGRPVLLYEGYSPAVAGAIRDQVLAMLDTGTSP